MAGKPGCVRLKRFCINGHEYTPENTQITSKGTRDCRICRKARNQANSKRRAVGRLGQRAYSFAQRIACLRRNEELFWQCVDRPSSEACWIWGGRFMPNGYGRIGLYDSDTHADFAWVAHRAAWELLRGEIPAGMQLDHLCRVRACINPAHLEVVTDQENRRRKDALRTHCARGHLKTPENWYYAPDGQGRCGICMREKCRQNAAARRSLHRGAWGDLA